MASEGVMTPATAAMEPTTGVVAPTPSDVVTVSADAEASQAEAVVPGEEAVLPGDGAAMSEKKDTPGLSEDEEVEMPAAKRARIHEETVCQPAHDSDDRAYGKSIREYGYEQHLGIGTERSGKPHGYTP